MASVRHIGIRHLRARPAGGTDYVKSDINAIRNARVADLRKYYPTYTPPTPDVWLNEMREVVRWVERINARGGKVVFYREPVSANTSSSTSRIFRAKVLGQTGRHHASHDDRLPRLSAAQHRHAGHIAH